MLRLSVFSSLFSILAVPAEAYTNTLGMDLVEVPAGRFIMGNDEGHWDQAPAHEVEIHRGFLMGEREVTASQFRSFRPDAEVRTGENEAVCGVTWRDAVAFCEWLSEKEGKLYRLPTEAEWEYACRAGTSTPFSSGEARPESGTANAWGLVDMHRGVREWCLDWYGDYAEGAHVDPVGPESGWTKVVRGGGLDDDEDRYASSFNRAGLPPSFGLSKEKASPGDHCVGFRVVQAPLPETPLATTEPSFVLSGVKREAPSLCSGPPPDRPYFRKRFILPSPPETSSEEAFHETILKAGLHSSFRGHNHSPALEVCPNGDLLMVIYTSWEEYEPEVSLIASRLRWGSDQWDMPSRFIDTPGANDHAPLLWRDGEMLRLFWGNPRLSTGGAFPFQWTMSKDSGATWSEIRFPTFSTDIGPHSKQPINTAFRDKEGSMYVASDGNGGSSVLWVSRNDGETWEDTGSRSGGRHTTYVLLKDGRILGMGGKNTDIDGYMPKSISEDGGKTWVVSRTPFPALGGNQRPSIVRLKSGRLFFASDFQKAGGVSPVEERGAFVALSSDEGETWRTKRLWGAQPHENPDFHKGATTVGYSVARQAENGVIHLMTTMNRPCLHFEMNEAWILSEEPGDESDATLMLNKTQKVKDVERHVETYADGSPQFIWHAGIGDDGRYLLHGTETWFYPDGKKRYEAKYALGRKRGKETLWRLDGSREWEWDHGKNGESTWTQWDPKGTVRSTTLWKDFHWVERGD